MKVRPMMGLGGEGEHHHDDHRDKGRDHADLLLDELRAGVAERGGDIGVVGLEGLFHRVESREARLVCLGVVKGHRKQGRGLVVVLCRVVKGDALHAVDPFELFKKGLRLLVGEVCRHELGRAVGDELLLHHVQALLRRGARGQIGRQIILYLDPIAGEEGKDHEDADEQEDEVSFVHNECGQLHHEAAVFFVRFIHDSDVLLYDSYMENR